MGRDFISLTESRPKGCSCKSRLPKSKPPHR